MGLHGWPKYITHYLPKACINGALNKEERVSPSWRWSPQWQLTASNIGIKIYGNISGGNQPLHANYRNFNLNHTVLIKRGAQRRWEEWFAKLPLQITPLTSHEFCKSPFHLSWALPWIKIEWLRLKFFIVCMKRSVCTRYVAKIYNYSLRP
jgi:hypothetical protein